MFHSRFIQIVVPLSLIVVMMIQPAMALVFASDCGLRCASSFLCDGCGCCKVASPDEKCCCCNGGKSTETEKRCCREESEDSLIGSASVDESGDSVTEVEIVSTCGCGVESMPVGETAPARPTVPTRESVAIRQLDLADLFGSSLLARRPFGVHRADYLPAHFSQIQLCIWRL